MTSKEFRQTAEAAAKLFQEESTSFDKIESAFILLKGIDPKIDKLIDASSKELGKLRKLQQGEFIELSAEGLPENTEEEKKRKKALLLFLKYWRQLKAEVKRVDTELGEMKNQGQVNTVGKIAAWAKGPFGIITITAVILVTAASLFQNNKANPQGSVVAPSDAEQTIQAIEFQGKKIPLSELVIGKGTECLSGKEQAPHYHAKDHATATAIDGSSVTDPGGCGFGKVQETKVIESSQ